jgi:hypothetical protein
VLRGWQSGFEMRGRQRRGREHAEIVLFGGRLVGDFRRTGVNAKLADGLGSALEHGGARTRNCSA